MNKSLAARLDSARADFAEVTGKPFQHFYCPILFNDVETELCKGHVINQAVAGVDRKWVVQRKDVDGFFGYTFESDFVLLEKKYETTALYALSDGTLARQLGAQIRFRGKAVEHYRPSGTLPDTHTPIEVTGADGKIVRLALKMDPNDVLEAEGKDWEFIIERDIRVQALASMLKAAHLTLFHMLGYQYALSAAGHFLGRDVLGKFYLDNVSAPRELALENAKQYFSEYQNVARPILNAPGGIRGTVSDRRVYLCKTDAWPWAMMVFLRTGAGFHAVMVPVFEHEHAIAHFFKFMTNPSAEILAHLAEFHGDRWEVSPSPQRFEWPTAHFTD